jgi:hypothetical protein
MIRGQGDMMVRKLGNTRYKDAYKDFSIKERPKTQENPPPPPPKRKMDLDPNAVDAVAKANIVASPRRNKTDGKRRRDKEARESTDFQLEGQKCLGSSPNRGQDADSLPKISPVRGMSPSKLVDNKFGYVKSHMYQLETLKKKRVNLPDLEKEISQSAQKHLYACQVPHQRGSKRSEGVKCLTQTIAPEMSLYGGVGYPQFSEQTTSSHVPKVNLVNIQKMNRKSTPNLPSLDSPENIYLDVTLPRETRVTGT